MNIKKIYCIYWSKIIDCHKSFIMCGINYSKVKIKFNKFDYRKNFKKIKKFIHGENLSSALKLVKKFRNNYIFIEIINGNSDVINNLKSILRLIKIIEAKKNFNQFDYLNDLKWIIESEIFFKTKRIIEFLEKNKIKITVNSIIFARFFLYNIESMNYLESRGRDSLGISINFIFKKKINLKPKNKNGSNLSLFCKNFIQKSLLNVTAKYSNRIGMSGENSSKIIQIFEKEKIFNKFNFKDLINFEIYSHTRWASVGEVTNSNAHPLLDINKGDLNLCLMNGDINNYKEIKNEFIRKKIFFLNDIKCKSDLQVIPSLFYKNKFNLDKIAHGSYVLFNFNSSNVNDLFIYKKGSQGLYYTLDEDDNMHFASDVYGLINKTDKFKILKQSGIFKINDNFQKSIRKTFFTKTDLLTLDLSLKGKETFFQKEINDTEIFLKRSLNEYIDFKKNQIIGFKNLFDKKFKNKLIKRKIKNIIFTGMGSCYTAAVGISKYLNLKLYKEGYQDIKVEATIASEGSGFYLSSNMEDTIIIVIAQSGTTIDTNVFAKMAKERGAFTIALVNKKQGDVTYIVDQSFYLGNGRDVEMAVPSTKTYTCHLITGFILSEKIIELLTSKVNKNFIKSLFKIASTNSIQKNLFIINQKIQRLNIDILKYKNWMVVYDDSFSSFSALELRIKLSECCYKSIPYISLKKFNKMNYKNSLIFYLSSSNKLKKIDKSNYYIFSSRNVNLNHQNNYFNLKLNSKDLLELVIEQSLLLQTIAYKIAKMIDYYSYDKARIINNLKKISQYIVDKKKLNEFNKFKTNTKINFLEDKLKRPIDAIKHQAKSVTVGAIRSIETKNEKISNENKFNDKFKETKFNSYFDQLDEKINIYSDELFDYEKYYIGNIIEYCNSELKTNKYYKFFLNSEKKKNKKIFKYFN